MASTLPTETLASMQQLLVESPYNQTVLSNLVALFEHRSKQGAILRRLVQHDMHAALHDLISRAHQIDAEDATSTVAKARLQASTADFLKAYEGHMSTLLSRFHTAATSFELEATPILPQDYLSELTPGSVHSIRAFISLVISPSTLATLPAALIAQQGNPLTHLGNHLQPYLLLLCEARGTLVCATFVEELLVAGFDELSSIASEAGRTRARELEEGIINVLEAVESLILSFHVK